MWWNYVARSRDEIIEARSRERGRDGSAAIARRARSDTAAGPPWASVN